MTGAPRERYSLLFTARCARVPDPNSGLVGRVAGGRHRRRRVSCLLFHRTCGALPLARAGRVSRGGVHPEWRSRRWGYIAGPVRMGRWGKKAGERGSGWRKTNEEKRRRRKAAHASLPFGKPPSACTPGRPGMFGGSLRPPSCGLSPHLSHAATEASHPGPWPPAKTAMGIAWRQGKARARGYSYSSETGEEKANGIP